MKTEVKIPSVGESITSGQLSVWHKADGADIEEGELIFTLETDKVSTEVTAPCSGVLRHLAGEGDEVKIGQVVAEIEPGTGRAAQAGRSAANKQEQPRKADSPKPDREQSASTETKAARFVPPKAAPPPPKLVAEPFEPRLKVAGQTEARVTRKKLSPLRRKIATQLVAAQHTAAILTTFNECDMTAVMQLRALMQDAFLKKHGVKLGFMSVFIKAVVEALRAVSSINSRMDGDDLVLNHYYDIGVAVGTERGLMVPVIRDCDHKSFGEIELDLADFAKRAREGRIGIDDLQGGVFSITNGGIYGSLMSTPILNPPQSGILGMHKIQDRPVVVNGRVEIRPMMYLALTYDHRVVDGKEAVTFLVRVKDCIEEPGRMLLGV